MTTASLDVLGAPASTAGDDFHELWALRQALGLLDPHTELRSLVVEGLPKDAVHAQVGDAGQAADVTRVLRDGAIVYEQLKYSVANPGSPWTWARLMARRVASRRDTSVLGKLAKLYLKTAGVRRMRLVTNQPLDEAVRRDLARLPDALRAKGETGFTQLDTLEASTGLRGPRLAEFLEAFDLSGFGEATRLHLETDILTRISRVIDADARTDLRALHERVSALILPENRNHPDLDRETILSWLGAGTHALLFPARSNITPPVDFIQRHATPGFIQAILSPSPRLIRLHAEGGCGKTSFVSRLGDHLPDGSEAVLFDCYGGGLFLASNGRRHLPQQAFVQVANELAGRLGSPFALRPSGMADLTVAFRNRVSAAAEILTERAPEAILAIVFDAADNARTAADRWGEPCFLDELTAIAGWPDNVRIILTCRSGRRSALGPDARFDDLHLVAFDSNETRSLIAKVQPTWPSEVILELQDLSGGVPRRLAYALDGARPDHPDDAVERLMPRAPGMDPLFAHRVREAGLRIGDEDAVWRLLCALANLPRPTPDWVLASAADIKAADIAGLANDLGGLLLHPAGWSFHDEDFEAFAGEQSQAIAPAIRDRACDILLAHRDTDPYSARSVGEALLTAGRTDALYDLAQREDPGSCVTDEAELMALRHRRIALALRAARRAGETIKVQALLLNASHALRSQKLLQDTLTGNLDLSSRFSPDAVMTRVLTQARYSQARGSLRLLRASMTAASAPAEARHHLRWWHAWLEDRRLRPQGLRGSISHDDLVCEFEARRQLYGLKQAVEDLLRWRPHRTLTAIADRLAALAIQQDRAGDITEVLSQRRWARLIHVHLAAIRLNHGLGVPEPELRNALEGLVRNPPKPYDRTGQDRGLSVIEAATRIEPLRSLAANALVRVWDAPRFKTTDRRRWVESLGDLVARAIALREGLDQSPVALEPWLPDLPPEPARPPVDRWGRIPLDADPEAERAHREWRGRAKDRSEDLDALRQLVEIARLRRDQPGSEAVGDEAEKFAARDSGGRQSLEGAAQSFRALHAADLITLGLPLDQARAWLTAVPFPSMTLARLGLLARRTGRIAELADVLNTVAAGLQIEPAPASARSALLIDCARLALRFDEDLARLWYERALSVSADVDLEAIDYLHAAAACSVEPVEASLEDRRLLALRLTDAACAVQRGLGDEAGEYMPWAQVLSSSAVQHFPTALAVAGQWRDNDDVGLEECLEGLCDPVCRPEASDGLWVVLSALGRTGDLDEARTGAEVESACRRALIDGSRERISDSAEAISGLASEYKAGPWASRLIAAAALLPKPDQRTAPHPEKAVASPSRLRTKAELEACVEDLARDAERPDAVHFTAIADRIASPALRVSFLSTLAERYSGARDLAWFLSRTLPDWTDYPTVNAWILTTLPGIIERSLPHLFAFNYRDTDLLDQLLALIDRSPAEKVDILLRAVERHGDNLPAGILIALTGVITRLSDPIVRAPLLNALLDHTFNALPPQASTAALGPVAPEDPDEVTARWLFALMADVDKRVRWRASHAARALLNENRPAFAAAFVALIDRIEEPVFARPDLFFYLDAAHLQVAVTLHRVALENPKALNLHLRALARAAHGEASHVLIRQLLRDAALAVNAGSDDPLDTASLTGLQALNRPAKRRQKGRPPQTPSRFMGGRRENERYHFDDTDTLPYWYAPAARVFGVGLDTFATMAERWICDVWAVPGDPWRFAQEPRRPRFSNLEYGLSSHRHGSDPTVERLARYAEWHAMFRVMGELLEKGHFRTDRYSETFEDWLARSLPTERSFWLSDLLGAPPLEPRFWAEDHQLAETESWRTPVETARFRSELMSNDDAFVVAGAFNRTDRDISEHVRISSALVSSKTAHALASALETAQDSMDFCLPSGGVQHAIKEPGFILEGWLAERHRDPRLDAPDEARRSVDRLPVKPLADVFGPTTLTFDLAARAWRDSASGDPVVWFDQWGWDFYESEAEGWRAYVSPQALSRLLTERDRSLIIEVKVIRTPKNDDGAMDRRVKSWRLFVIDQSLTLSGVTAGGLATRSGRYWVHRLGIERTVDTLGRWLAHHVAALDIRRRNEGATGRKSLEKAMAHAVKRLNAPRPGNRWF